MIGPIMLQLIRSLKDPALMLPMVPPQANQSIWSVRLDFHGMRLLVGTRTLLASSGIKGTCIELRK